MDHLNLATTTASKWQPPHAPPPSNNRRRVFGAQSAPVFHPTLKEWANPLEFIESIRGQGERAGIVKVVPPKSWTPGFHVDQNLFRFETRIQKLNSIDGASRSTVNYLDQLELFHQQSRNNRFQRVPILSNNKPLDLWILKKKVEKRGGFAQVSKEDKWLEIATSLGDASSVNLIRDTYVNSIHPYERFVAANLSLSLSGNENNNGAPKSMGMGRMMTSQGRMMKRIAEHNEKDVDKAPIPVSSNCQICNKGKHIDPPTSFSASTIHPVKLLKCDECKMRFHTTCLTPPITTLPPHEWYCALCLKTHGDDFGFLQEGSLQSLAQFQKVADGFKESYFRRKREQEGTGSLDGKVYVGEEEMEEEFWKLVEEDRFNEDGVEVQYGADLHSSVHGSGFPSAERDPSNPYSHCPWNLNNLPILQSSLFTNIRNDISGMMVPWLYVGMAFSAFCWHTEDHYTYSINYNHFGDTKTWYGIPASDAVRFEVLMKKKCPELFVANPDLLFHLTTIMGPKHLAEGGVQCFSVDQRAGEFVITFPRAYHAGFNQGLNFAEAVNFAIPSWLPYGLSCVDRYIKFHKQPVFSHEELVIATALKDSSVKTSVWLKPEIDILCDRELTARAKIRSAHAAHMTEIIETESLTSQSRDIFCEVCRAYCFCTSIGLACAAENTATTDAPKVVCYRHVEQLQSHCECPTKAIIVRIRYTDESLRALQSRVAESARAPEEWIKQYTSLIAGHHRPPLHDMQALVTSGEKDVCGFVMEECVALKGFVHEAEKWVSGVRHYFGDAFFELGSSTKLDSPSSQIKSKNRKVEKRTLESAKEWLNKVEELPFDCQEIGVLSDAVRRTETLRDAISKALSNGPETPKEVEDTKNIISGVSIRDHNGYHCFCRASGTDVKGTNSVTCRDCNVVYHSKCIGLKEDMLKGPQDYVCPICDTETVFKRIKPNRLSLDQLIELLSQRDSSALALPDSEILKLLVNKLTPWRNRVVHLNETATKADVTKVKDELRALEGFAFEISNTVADALYDKLCEFRREVREVSVQSTVPSEIDNESPTPCGTCRQLGVSDMIGCDVCDEWFHFSCVGVKPEEVEHEETYKCPGCEEKESSRRPKIKLRLPMLDGASSNKEKRSSGSEEKPSPKRVRIQPSSGSNSNGRPTIVLRTSIPSSNQSSSRIERPPPLVVDANFYVSTSAEKNIYRRK